MITTYGYLLGKGVLVSLLMQFLLTQNHNYVAVENIKMNAENKHVVSSCYETVAIAIGKSNLWIIWDRVSKVTN